MKKIKAIVSGKVQGVGFRYTSAQARQLGVCGYVRNLCNGNVEIVAKGEAEAVDELLEWAKSGSPSAVVKNIKNIEVEVIANNLEKFEIRH